MNFVDVLVFLQSYSLPSFIIALTISGISAILRFILKDKIPQNIYQIAPPILCWVLHFIYSVIFTNNAFVNITETLSACTVCSSFNLIISAIINKTVAIIKGKCVSNDTSLASLAIEELLRPYVKEKILSSLTKSIINAIDDCFINGNELPNSMAEKVIEKLKDNVDGDIDVNALAIAIITAYKAVKNL